MGIILHLTLPDTIPEIPATVRRIPRNIAKKFRKSKNAIHISKLLDTLNVKYSFFPYAPLTFLSRSVLLSTGDFSLSHVRGGIYNPLKGVYITPQRTTGFVDTKPGGV